MYYLEPRLESHCIYRQASYLNRQLLLGAGTLPCWSDGESEGQHKTKTAFVTWQGRPRTHPQVLLFFSLAKPNSKWLPLKVSRHVVDFQYVSGSSCGLFSAHPWHSFWTWPVCDSWVLGSMAHSSSRYREQLHPSVHNEMNSNLGLLEENSKQTRQAKPTNFISIITIKQKCAHSTKRPLLPPPLNGLTETHALCTSAGQTMQSTLVRLVAELGGHFLPAPKGRPV